MSGGDVLRETCDRLEDALGGPLRERIVGRMLAPGPEEALARLRRALRAQRFGSGPEALELERSVRKLDQRTRREGFRVLHSWDHTEHRFRDDITPVLMLDYYVRERARSQSGDPGSREGGGAEAASGATARPGLDSHRIRTAVEILLDYYFLHVLALCALRAWDDDEPDAVLDRVSGLVALLQGPDGSGHQFVADAETAIIYALSQFHPQERAYDRFIERMRALRADRQVRFALVSAAVLSCHLRWGFWLMYGRDALRMRQDNVGDYPWLLDSVLTLLRAYDRMVAAGGEGGTRVVEGLLQALAADPWAFTGKAPAVLAGHGLEHDEVRELLRRHGPALIEELERHRPSRGVYAPLALHFNFPHNVVVAAVAMSLLEGQPRSLPLDALFVGPAERARGGSDREVTVGAGAEGTGGADAAAGGESASAANTERFARGLMEYSGGRVDRLGAGGALLVAYDPLSGSRSFSMTVDALRESLMEE